MYKLLFSPEILFLLGIFQVFIPYLIWNSGKDTYEYELVLSYKPLVIFVSCYFSFLVGSMCCGYKQYSARIQITKPSLIKSVTTLSIVSSMLNIGMILLFYKMYGRLPIIGLLMGTLQIHEADESLTGDFTSLRGVFVATLCVHTGVILLALIQQLESKKFRWFNPSLIFMLMILVVGTTMGGKRQGLVMGVVFIITGLGCFYQNKLEDAITMVFSKVKSFNKFLFVVIGFSIFVGFEYVGKVRSGREATIFSKIESFKYLELPTINLEYQCAIADYGPYEFSLIGPLRYLILNRFINTERYSDIPKLEIYSPSGMYEYLHWYTGVYGCLIFAFVIGFYCRYLYNHANYSIFCLLAYSQVTWNLITCHSYNHFLNIFFIPGPIIGFYLATVIFIPPYSSYLSIPNSSLPALRKRSI